MAIIQCPECGQTISNEAEKCIHCGHIFVKDINEIHKESCPECGIEPEDGAAVCRECANRVETDTSAEPVQDVAATNGNAEFKENTAVTTHEDNDVNKQLQSTKKKKTMIAAFAAAAVIIVAITIIITLNANATKKYNNYVFKLSLTKEAMLIGASDSETLCNLTAKVWYNAIFEKDDSDTDPYTKTNGVFVEDFNTALSRLYVDAVTTSEITSIKINQETVEGYMKDLREPPKELQQCYDTISDLYDAYGSLTELAIRPTGNYRSYTDTKNSAVSDFLTAYRKLETQIPGMK